MYKLLLCLRYLRTRHIALASVISVMLGVATMIVVNSVMSGFATQMRERIHGILADMVFEVNSTDGVPNPENFMRKIDEAAGEYIESMSPTVEIYGMMSFQYYGQWITRPITLIGIDPVTKSEVGILKEHLGNYKPSKVRGREVAPPRRLLSQLPDWELEREDQNLRRKRAIEQSRLQALQEEKEKEAEEGKDELNMEEDLGSELANEGNEEEQVDPGEPLKGRLYIGIGLISYQHEEKVDGKSQVETELMIRPGDDIKISTVSAGRPPQAVHFDATVVDTFESGMSEYDSSLVFCNLDFLQEVRGMIDPESGSHSFTSIQIKLRDYQDAETVVKRLQAVFPPGLFTVRTWEQKQGPLLAAVAVETAILNILLFLIIAVAGFGILAIFFMIVVEKTRDIGILKALGAGSGGIMSIFLSYGLALGIVGSGAGVILGLSFVANINTIEKVITQVTGQKVFDDRIYYFPEIPTNVQPWTVIAVAAGALAIAVLASILPARKAARLHPVLALRYE